MCLSGVHLSFFLIILGHPTILLTIPSIIVFIWSPNDFNIYCLFKNGPVVIWVACIGLKWSSKLPLRSARYFSRPFGLKVQKASEKALALLKGNLELPLRPIQATKMTTGPFWTRQKRLEAFWTSNRNFVTKTHSPLKEPKSSPSHWNTCVHTWLKR